VQKSIAEVVFEIEKSQVLGCQRFSLTTEERDDQTDLGLVGAFPIKQRLGLMNEVIDLPDRMPGDVIGPQIGGIRIPNLPDANLEFVVQTIQSHSIEDLGNGFREAELPEDTSKVGVDILDRSGGAARAQQKKILFDEATFTKAASKRTPPFLSDDVIQNVQREPKRRFVAFRAGAGSKKEMDLSPRGHLL
jgi:hypothetical protein